MTKQQIEQAAETHADKYSDDPHAIAKESFIAGVLWIIDDMNNNGLALPIKRKDFKEIYDKYEYLLK